MFRDAPTLPGMKPWIFEYSGPDGGRYGIVLHGSDPDQIERDNWDRLPNLEFVGELIGTIED